LEDLPSHEDRKDHDKSDEQADNDTATPWMRLTGILQRKNVRDDQSHHQCSANEIQLQKLLFPRGLRRPSILRHDEQEKYHNRCDSADGQVDVEALG
jgi:hypothetical protein